MQYFIYYLTIINIVAFFLMGIDKKKAQTGAWRIPEKTLFLSAILGGSIGALAGMRVFHHKTRKTKFRLGVPVALLLWLLLIGALVVRMGMLPF